MPIVRLSLGGGVNMGNLRHKKKVQNQHWWLTTHEVDHYDMENHERKKIKIGSTLLASISRNMENVWNKEIQNQLMNRKKKTSAQLVTFQHKRKAWKQIRCRKEPRTVGSRPISCEFASSKCERVLT